jgi:hypothetical protein
MKHSKEGRRNNLGNKELAAKLRAIEKANPGMKYRALFLSTIGDVAALESDGQVDGLKAAMRIAVKELREMAAWDSKEDKWRMKALADALDAAASEESR